METNLKTCPDCDGQGSYDHTSCCGQEFYPGTNICSECGKRAERWKCETCNGTGKIEIDPLEAAFNLECEKADQYYGQCRGK